MECPKFDDVDEKTVGHAFNTGYGDKEDSWYAKLSQDVARASAGKVVLTEDKSDDHSMKCSCGGSKYGRVSDKFSKVEVTFTTGMSNPFVCEDRTTTFNVNKTANPTPNVSVLGQNNSQGKLLQNANQATNEGYTPFANKTPGTFAN